MSYFETFQHPLDYVITPEQAELTVEVQIHTSDKKETDLLTISYKDHLALMFALAQTEGVWQAKVLNAAYFNLPETTICIRAASIVSVYYFVNTPNTPNKPDNE